MFFKLIKYEWNAMMRRMLPVYITVLILAAFNYFLWGGPLKDFTERLNASENSFLMSVGDFFRVLAAGLYICVLIALFVILFITIIQRFYRGLLKEEGYLMFTLPVRTGTLVTSKAVVSFLVMLPTVFVGLMSILFLSGNGVSELFTSIINGCRELYRTGMQEVPRYVPHMILYVLEFQVLVVVSTFADIYHLYLSMALGQLSGSHRILMSVVWYIAIGIGGSMTSWYLLSAALSSAAFFSPLERLIEGIHLSAPDAVIIAIHACLLVVLAAELIWLIAEAIMTNYLLDKRLNLE
ncbi:MAG: hypothetical protein Q4C63_08615 [Eubacteriales bacterium]|nr:hypothetical protein [Eubacteriales bacterium]